MKNILPLIIAALLLSAVPVNAGWFTDDFATTNQMIIDANANNRRYYADGMAACNGNAACQVGITSAYFSMAGQQQLIKPETLVDVLRAFLPYADLGVGLIRTYRSGTNGDSSGFLVTGNGNTFMGVGNKTSADNGSSASTSISAEYARAEDHNNRTYSLGGDKGGISDEVVTTYIPTESEVK